MAVSTIMVSLDKMKKSHHGNLNKNIYYIYSTFSMGGAKEGLAGASAPPRGGIAPP